MTKRRNGPSEQGVTGTREPARRKEDHLIMLLRNIRKVFARGDKKETTKEKLYSDIERAIRLYKEARALVSDITDELLTMADDRDDVFDAACALEDGDIQSPEDFLEAALGPGYKTVLKRGAAGAAGGDPDPKTPPVLTARASDFADYVVRKAIDDERPINNLQLQNILYLIQEHYVRLGRLAFGDIIEAWGFGPAIPNVYYRYGSVYGAMPIYYASGKESRLHLVSEDERFVDEVTERVSAMEPMAVVAIIKRNSAWQQVFNDGKGYKKEIPIELIRTAGGGAVPLICAYNCKQGGNYEEY